MALSTSTPATTWGDIHVRMGDTGATGAMATDLEDVGSLDENGVTIETADGTTLSLKDINGKTLDELRQEPELTINFTILKPSQATRGKFWKLTEATGKVVVNSFVSVDHKSVKISSDRVVGSETFEAPNCSMNMKFNFTAEKGFYAECSAKLLFSDAISGYFQFGTIASAE